MMAKNKGLKRNTNLDQNQESRLYLINDWEDLSKGTLMEKDLKIMQILEGQYSGL